MLYAFVQKFDVTDTVETFLGTKHPLNFIKKKHPLNGFEEM